ncbi:hypothetical protein RclHR1_07450002 [Rhizophagus clarus]|uniref:Uncharacterized protein n=1 Tax=Rhizophagus clarus TaxID=94130 RepID=A0A2Z6RX86_9GLOM|nr:hypothetical protein RclHR1_07450002 [Rhizophagus clarus]GES83939.1 hypothetical protein RCL_e24955_RclHR1_07450002 [Rhizophagus clarus]
MGRKQGSYDFTNSPPSVKLSDVTLVFKDNGRFRMKMQLKLMNKNLVEKIYIDLSNFSELRIRMKTRKWKYIEDNQYFKKIDYYSRGNLTIISMLKILLHVISCYIPCLYSLNKTPLD